MKCRRLFEKVLYLLIISSFLFDAYYKLSNVSKEGDLLRSKYQLLFEFYKSSFGVTLPITPLMVTQNSEIIVQVFACFELIAAMLVLMGVKWLSWGLIISTLLHTSVVHNPWYKNTTEIDK